MSDSIAVKNRVYMEAIKTMRRLFAARYQHGGWLPPGRDMAKELGLCDRTYWKALARMVNESFVRSYPRQGYYVLPARFRCRKVGLILEDGVESPFIPGNDNVSEAITHLLSRGLHSHLIQGRSPAQLQENAVIHGVEGLLWFNPPPQAATTTKDIAEEACLPLVLVHANIMLEELDFGACEVGVDMAQDAVLRAETMLSRGHRKIGYVGYYQFARRFGMVEALAKGGVELTPGLCVPATNADTKKISTLIKRHGLTGLISEGCGFDAYRLFEELSTLPEALRPEILPFDTTLHHEFPGLKFVCLRKCFASSPGKLAATILANHLLDGAPLASAQSKLILEG